jgi:hypothetical protein
MFTPFFVWLRAQGIYALMMLPTLGFYPMFLMAEFYAWIWGVPALAFFWLFLWVLKKQALFNLPALLAAGFIITLLCTYGAAWHFADFKNPWKEFQEWILFPAAGCGAAVLAIVVSRKRIEQYLIGEKETELHDLELQVLPEHRN